MQPLIVILSACGGARSSWNSSRDSRPSRNFAPAKKPSQPSPVQSMNSYAL